MIHKPANYVCDFCELAAGRPPERLRDVVYEDDCALAFVSRDWKENNPGHVLVIPKRHSENLYDIPISQLERVVVVTKMLAIPMRFALGCEGLTIRQNNEPVGNQDVWHYHMHVIPRYPGDNYGRTEERTIDPDVRAAYAKRIRDALTSP